MTRKSLDTMREVRLWIGQIVVPGVILGASVMSIPEVRSAVASKAKEVKMEIDRKIKRKERGS